MLLIHDIKCKPSYTEEDLINRISTALKIMKDDILSYEIYRLSVDARKKPDIFLNISVIAKVKNEAGVLRRNKSNAVSLYQPVEYKYELTGTEELTQRPVIVGSGPAGLFAAYYLAVNGYKPIVIERGYDVDSRLNAVEKFWESGQLNPNCNVQFGEGGAGTFSDGKLNTLVKDKSGRNKAVLDLFVKFGADNSIKYHYKPHIGTDVLMDVVKGMREEIKSYGGEFLFNAQMTDIIFEDSKVKAIMVNDIKQINTSLLVLAIGHSARDTFKLLYDKGIHMSCKDFAVGFRVEHPQSKINYAMYGSDKANNEALGAAPYKLTYKGQDNRGVYSFCMCPGGYVVNASSEKNRLCINGMSYSKRDGNNANSAIVVTVSKEEFGSAYPLAGVEFQRKIEENAYNAAEGKIPVSLYKDFKKKVDGSLTDLNDNNIDMLYMNKPQTKGLYDFADISKVLPDNLNKQIVDGMTHFGKIIKGFDDDYTLLSAVEARTSSPVRIERDESFEAIDFHGLYPCGEGAGYAGGITSAAMDGMKVFEAIAAKYKPLLN